MDGFGLVGWRTGTEYDVVARALFAYTHTYSMALLETFSGLAKHIRVKCIFIITCPGIRIICSCNYYYIIYIRNEY
jgi:hypothetical protein